ncbi:MAG: hypothetical protein H6550_02225 [Chitinophagales bacterium]|nr:hypothetical protein [Chitinophagales bacterium]
MYCITDEQVEYILDDIRRNGVEMEDLQFNLLDHICCIIEYNLKEGDDFEVFYQQTVRQFYKNDLKEIEEETINLLTFKNYYAMKKLMIISGASAAFILLTGSLFKLAHWPGAGILFVTGMVLFSLLFLPVLFLLKTKEAGSARDKVVLTTGTLVGILYCLSALFLVMHWPGARIMWISTLTLSFFVLLPVYFFNGIRKPETKLNTIVTTIILVGVLGVQFLLTPVHNRPKTEQPVATEAVK